MRNPRVVCVDIFINLNPRKVKRSKIKLSMDNPSITFFTKERFLIILFKKENIIYLDLKVFIALFNALIVLERLPKFSAFDIFKIFLEFKFKERLYESMPF